MWVFAGYSMCFITTKVLFLSVRIDSGTFFGFFFCGGIKKRKEKHVEFLELVAQFTSQTQKKKRLNEFLCVFECSELCKRLRRQLKN